MAATDNKVLTGAGVETLIGLIKANTGIGADEIYIGTSTPSTSQYKVWIDPSGQTDTFMKGITLNGSSVALDGNYIANLTNIQTTLTAGDNVNISSSTISAIPAYKTTTNNSNLSWNTQVLRSATATTAISALQPSTTYYSQEILGFFLSSGTSCSFTVANANIICGEDTTTNAGDALSVEVEDNTLYEFSLLAISDTLVSLIVRAV